MGKKSKRRARGGPAVSTQSQPRAGNASSPETTEDAALQRVLAPPDNLIQRQRFLCPNDWDENIASIHPFIRPEIPYICIDAELSINKGSEPTRAKKIVHFADCPICFQDATLSCSRCGTVNYCGKEHQNLHWKKSHKKACCPNPNPSKFELALDMFRGLTEDCFEGHEFLVIRPTERLGSLQDICDQVLEPADDLLDMPGFGANQFNAKWFQDNQRHPTYKRMVQKFGWTSGMIGLELVSGYRAAEARIIYFCFCDDSFQMQTDLSPSYYGRALFPPLPAGRHVRGNLVIYKLALKNKRLRPPPQNPATAGQRFLNMQLTDDADLEFEFILFPTNKAEIALMLSERCKALDKGSFTTRMWRYPIRQKERQTELQATNATASGASLTVALG